MGLIKIILLSSLVSFGWQVEATDVVGIDLGEPVKISINGPIEIQLGYAEIASVSFDSSLVVIDQRGAEVTFTASEPTKLFLQLRDLDNLHVIDGALLIKLVGSERLRLGQVSAPDVCISLQDRARFESKELSGEHLQISLSGQGKASLSNVVADVFELDLTDHSDIEMAGEIREQDVDIRGYSHYDGTALKSITATVALDGYAAGLIQASNTPTVTASPFSSLSMRSSKPI